MITSALMQVATLIFAGIAGIMRNLFPTAFSTITDGIASLSAQPGWRLGLGIMDRCVGLDFLFMALNGFLLIVLVGGVVKAVLGVVTKK
jgi:hypothetical protein